MVETLQNVQQLYSKWDSRNPRQPGDEPRPNGPSRSMPAASLTDRNYSAAVPRDRQAWNSKYSAVRPFPERRRKYQSSESAVLPLVSILLRTDGIDYYVQME